MHLSSHPLSDLKYKCLYLVIWGKKRSPLHGLKAGPSMCWSIKDDNEGWHSDAFPEGLAHILSVSPARTLGHCPLTDEEAEMNWGRLDDFLRHTASKLGGERQEPKSRSRVLVTSLHWLDTHTQNIALRTTGFPHCLKVQRSYETFQKPKCHIALPLVTISLYGKIF